MTGPAPIPFVWREAEGGFFPLSGHRKRASDAYGDGEVVNLAPYEPRSKKSHDHFFAVLSEAWANLPEHLAKHFPTDDSLRHYALCKAGFCDVETFVASSKAEAPRFAAFLQAGARPGVQVTIDGARIIRLTPHSQSQAAMGNARFKESKDAVLEIVADMIGVSQDELSRAA